MAIQRGLGASQMDMFAFLDQPPASVVQAVVSIIATEDLGRAPAPSIKPANDFSIADEDDIGAGGAKTKFRQNIAAIQLLRVLEDRGTPATRDEQAVLAKFVGWGGIPQAFERSDGTFSKGWEKEGAQLRALLSADELDAAAASTRNAHYTSPEIVSAMWDAMRRLGFDGGRLLEPSIGVGNFFGLMPADLRQASALYGVELDRITGGIAKHLYPTAKIAAPLGFQNYTIPDNHFDAVIGNPPFGSEKLYDPLRKDLSQFSIHNYFFARAIDALRPGAVMAMVVTNRFLDGSNDAARQYIAARADLVAAIRLPNNAFLKNAGTQVTTDIVFLQKRAEDSMRGGAPWLNIAQYTDKDGNSVPLNEYFIANPENMLGEFGSYSTMYNHNGEAALVAREGQDTAALLQDAIARLPQGIVTGENADVTQEALKITADLRHVRVGSMFMERGVVMLREPDSLGESRAVEVEMPNAKAAERIAGMIGVRDAFATVRRLQLSQTATDTEIEAARREMNVVYDAFVRANGYINLDVNERLFGEDPSWPQIAALEDSFDKGVTPDRAKSTGQTPRKPSARKAAVFSRRTQAPYAPPTHADTAKDALVTSLTERGRVDMQLMESLYGKPSADILTELGDLVFDDPNDGLVTRDEYLSGNVKKKLAEARQKAQSDPAFERNVRALEEVQPADIEPCDIKIRIGAHWLPEKDMADFVAHITGRRDGKAFYNPVTSGWSISGHCTGEAEVKWATERRKVDRIIEAAANNKTITVYDKLDDGTSVVNHKETQAALEKVDAVKREFENWIFEGDDRRERLARLYNDSFNTTVQRRFDGSHLTFAGKVDDAIIALNPHQKDAVWRILQSPTTLLDHVVGAGKTFSIVAAVMEARRMGIWKKPVITVPNHLVGQWATDFIRLYPNANILAATKKDFEAKNRKRLFARIATGDWDAVIVAHSSFGKIEVDPEAQAEFIRTQVAMLVEAQETMRAAEGRDGRNVKQIRDMITRKEEKLKRLLDAGRKDDVLYWSELGIDALLVDEAHEFKNLEFTSGMQRVAGLGNQTGSQKASDMFLKVAQVLKETDGTNIVYATGTPISNTMAEMFTIQRYLDGAVLEEMGLHHFDAWARMFGEVVTDWELSPAGKYKLTSRFAKFVNMPELMQRYLSFADVITRDDIRRQLAEQGKRLMVPGVKGGRPQNIVVDRSLDQADYIGVPLKIEGTNEDSSTYPEDCLIHRAENLPRRAEKGGDNMLKIMSDARKAALDMRLINPDYPDYPGSKTNEAAKRIKAIYDQWSSVSGTQLVFCDLSTPKASRDREAKNLLALIEKADAGDEAAQEKLDAMSPDEMAALESSFSVYDDLRGKLVQLGIPNEEIEFVHSANTEEQKDDLFAKVRSGKIRVLLGSTAKMGAGTNVQERLVALHHLDAPWRPSDLEQREGRIVRQGNVLFEADPDGFEVEILRYATKQTLDSRMWQTIEAKANFIEQVRKGAGGMREIEDIGGEAANAAEMKAASSGNPLILEEMTLRQRVKKLQMEEYTWKQNQWRAKDRIKIARKENAETENRIARLTDDAGLSVPESFSITIRGVVFEKWTDAGRAILAEAVALRNAGGEFAAIGKYGDFRVGLRRWRADGNCSLVLSGKHDWYSDDFALTADPRNVALRLKKALPDASKIDPLSCAVANRNQTITKLQESIAAWPKKDELIKTQADHAEIIGKLKKKEKPAEEAKEPSVGGEGGVPDTDLSDDDAIDVNPVVIASFANGIGAASHA